METRISIDDKKVTEGLLKAPAAVERELEFGLDRWAAEVARNARELAPKSFSLLTNSIRSIVAGRLKRIVAPGVNYALAVEQGRRPGRQPGTGNGLMAWVRQKTGLSGAELERTTFLIARSIGRKGTRPQPYMQPAAEQSIDRGRILLLAAVDRGLKESLG
jgi:hypothetical protein